MYHLHVHVLFCEYMSSMTCLLLHRNDLIDDHHKNKKVVTQMEVNPKQVPVVPRIKEEKEQVIDILHYYSGTQFVPYVYTRGGDHFDRDGQIAPL